MRHLHHIPTDSANSNSIAFIVFEAFRQSIIETLALSLTVTGSVKLTLTLAIKSGRLNTIKGNVIIYVMAIYHVTGLSGHDLRN